MMKKFGKIFLVVAAVVALVLAMAAVASAAEISGVATSVSTEEGRTISVTVTYANSEPAQQSTVLVVKHGVDIATLADEDIKYINQETVSENTVTYNFKLLSEDRAGVYDVYVGGTAVDAPKSESFSFDTRKIIGTITVLGDATKATAVATANGVSTPGAVASTGAYEIEVGQGTYSVVLGKAGYLYKTYDNVAVADANVDLGTIALLGGDVSGDGMIDLDDLQAVLGGYKGSEESLDINNDGVIDLDEIQTILTNYKKDVNNAYNN